jgi:hypothetical protein
MQKSPVHTNGAFSIDFKMPIFNFICLAFYLKATAFELFGRFIYFVYSQRMSIYINSISILQEFIARYMIFMKMRIYCQLQNLVT